MKTEIQNHQRLSPVKQSILRQLIQSLTQRAHPLDPSMQWASIVLHLVDDDGIRVAHQTYFAQNTVTDVISQRYAPFPGETGCAGEIVVNVQQALRARKTRHWTTNHELALYIAHGIDHLHGSTDTTAPERQRMRRRELRWLRQLQQAGCNILQLGLEVR